LAQLWTVSGQAFAYLLGNMLGGEGEDKLFRFFADAKLGILPGIPGRDSLASA
jgi:hypothetical protein